jgi:type IV pilus assembly protein PilV
LSKLQTQPGYQSGVSMIEVLITILVSVIGLFSAMQLQLTAVSNTHSAYFRSQAAVISNGLVDQMRANPSGAIAGNYDITLGASAPSGSSVEATDLAQWRADLTVAMPSATGSVACVAATRICSLVVQWDDSRGLSGSGAEQFTLTLRLP